MLYVGFEIVGSKWLFLSCQNMTKIKKKQMRNYKSYLKTSFASQHLKTSTCDSINLRDDN